MRAYVGMTLTLIVSTLADNKSPSVDTPLGSIEGFWQVSRNGRQFKSYEGIPYALPPVGELRFEPPKPVAAWEGRLSAKFSPPTCLQYVLGSAYTEDTITGTEDCLYLNVYSPGEEMSNRNDTKLLPVIFHIHGGGFQMSASSNERPNFLMDNDIVLVTINYRLGPLGFLSTEDGVVPGNMGLKDQNLALRWVSENIESFGGDPNQVTLSGISAGAASVHYHYLSPMSRGLFHRGISLSGTALDCWAQAESAFEKAKKLAALLGCPTSCSEDLIRCLKSRPAKSILGYTSAFWGWFKNPYIAFGPVVEKGSATPFIDKSPIEIINNGGAADLPWITSGVTEEGLNFVAPFMLKEEVMKDLDENWEHIAPYLLDYNYTIPRSMHATVARNVRSNYMGDKPIELSNADLLIRMLSDRVFLADGGQAAKKHARVNRSPVWFYYFGYRGEYSTTDMLTGTKQNFGVSHGDDKTYVFSIRELHNDQDIQMSLKMVNMWISFATTGIPDVGIDWTPVNRLNEEFNYLRISKPGEFRIENDDNFGKQKFWNSIDFNENKLATNRR